MLREKSRANLEHQGSRAKQAEGLPGEGVAVHVEEIDTCTCRLAGDVELVLDSCLAALRLGTILTLI
jgi:hypothetical protein